MANNAKNVNVGKPSTAGAIYAAASPSKLPTTATEALASDFKSLGYISEDGLVNSNSPESDDLKAWGGDTVYTTQTGKGDTFQFTMIESGNVEVLKMVYGEDNVTEDADGNITVKANSKELPEVSWVVDMIMRGSILKRIVIPSGKVSEIGDISYTDDELIGYEVTVNAIPDTDGNTHYEYISGSGDSNSTGSGSTGDGGDGD